MHESERADNTDTDVNSRFVLSFGPDSSTVHRVEPVRVSTDWDSMGSNKNPCRREYFPLIYVGGSQDNERLRST